MFTNPLDKIRVASPCKAGWDQMFGDERRRFCGECKMNVYNLSEMTRTEAEDFLMASEGRLCVRFYRRADGTVLTKDCPVGWQALKKRVSTTATALASLVLGFFAGIFSVRAPETLISIVPMGDVPPVKLRTEIERARELPVIGEAYFDDVRWTSEAVDGQVDLSEFRRAKRGGRYGVLGRAERVQGFEDVEVKAWVR